MSVHIDYVSVCWTCGADVEHVTGISDPYWRHVAGDHLHAAKPDPDQARAVSR